MSSYVRLPALSIGDHKRRLHLFSDENHENDTEDRSRSLMMAQFNRPLHFLLVYGSNHVSIL